MNKKQIILVSISIVLFIFVTLDLKIVPYHPRSAIVGTSSQTRYKALSSFRPMYHYWAMIAVPFAFIFYLLKDTKNKDT